MQPREELIEALSDVCESINEHLASINAEYDYNSELNGALSALRSGDPKSELQKRFTQIDEAFFRRGERMDGYVNAGIVKRAHATRLEKAMGGYFRDESAEGAAD